jgi:hypothetical protein
MKRRIRIIGLLVANTVSITLIGRNHRDPVNTGKI